MKTKLDKSHTRALLSVRVGCAGWSIPKHTALHFPEGLNHLSRYSQLFNCCEINSSFYRNHRISTWQRWAAAVPADFRFAVKVPKAITHEARLVCSPEILLEFLKQAGHLGDKLGPLLVQLPPSLEFERDQVTAFFSLLRRHYTNDVVCEPRHGSWFTDQANEALQNFEIARVASDPACVPMASSPGGAPTMAYFRLHGSPRTYYSAYTDQFLDVISMQIKHLAAASRVWCIFDNTASGAATTNAMELRAKLHG